MPNDASSESSRQDVSNADRVGTGTIPTMGHINHGQSPQGGGVIYTVVVYGAEMHGRRSTYSFAVSTLRRKILAVRGN